MNTNSDSSMAPGSRISLWDPSDPYVPKIYPESEHMKAEIVAKLAEGLYFARVSDGDIKWIRIPNDTIPFSALPKFPPGPWTTGCIYRYQDGIELVNKFEILPYAQTPWHPRETKLEDFKFIYDEEVSKSLCVRVQHPDDEGKIAWLDLENKTKPWAVEDEVPTYQSFDGPGIGPGLIAHVTYRGVVIGHLHELGEKDDDDNEDDTLVDVEETRENSRTAAERDEIANRELASGSDFVFDRSEAAYFT
ncbi:hypothetical protein F5Y16DRAFT_398588 [Xylariaceae sp. FL0255]|nr:hypothetical protein F5Y16DRAFT_398588 [Xylariaceae sp. FL0255]